MLRCTTISVVLFLCTLVPLVASAHSENRVDTTNAITNCDQAVPGYYCSRSTGVGSDLDPTGLTEWRPEDSGVRTVAPLFPIRFGSDYFNLAFINANGFISFTEALDVEPGSEVDYPPVPNGTTPPNVGVALHGTDLWIGESLFSYGGTDEHGAIYYGTRGTAPAREFVYMINSGCHYWLTVHCDHPGDSDWQWYEDTDGRNDGAWTVSSAVTFEEETGEVRLAFRNVSTDCVAYDPVFDWIQLTGGDELETIGYELSDYTGAQFWRNQTRWADWHCHNWWLGVCWDLDGGQEHQYRDRIQNQTIRLMPPTPDPCGIAPYPEDDEYRCESISYDYKNEAYFTGQGLSINVLPNADDTPRTIDMNDWTWDPGQDCDSPNQWAAFIGDQFSDTLYMSPNGWVSLDSSSTYTAQIPPDSNLPNNVIAGWWEDLNPNLGGRIWQACDGTSPGRTMYMTWENVQHYGGGDAVTFQIQYEEATRDWEVHYDLVQPDGDANYEVAGWQDDNGNGVNYIATTLWDFNDESVHLYSKNAPCGEVSQLVVPAGQTVHVYCDILTPRLNVANTGTLHIHGPNYVWAYYEDDIERHIKGRVIIDEGAELYFDDYYISPPDTIVEVNDPPNLPDGRWFDCQEPYDAEDYDDWVWLDTTGQIDVYGQLNIDGCPNEDQAVRMFYFDGTINVFDTGRLRTVASDGATDGVSNGILRTQASAVLNMFADGAVQVGSLWVKAGRSVYFKNASNQHIIWYEALADAGSYLEFSGTTTTTFWDGYIRSRSNTTITGTATLNFEENWGMPDDALVDGDPLTNDYRNIILESGTMLIDSATTVTGYHGMAVMSGLLRVADSNVTLGTLNLPDRGTISVHSGAELQLDDGTLRQDNWQSDVTVQAGGRLTINGGEHRFDGDLIIEDGAPTELVITAPVAGSPVLRVDDDIHLYGNASHTGTGAVRVVGDAFMYSDADWSATAGILDIDGNLTVETNANLSLTANVAGTTIADIDVVGRTAITCPAGVNGTGRIYIADNAVTRDLGSVYVGSGNSSTCRSELHLSNTGRVDMAGVLMANRGEWINDSGYARVDGTLGGRAVDFDEFSRLEMTGGLIEVTAAGDVRFSNDGNHLDGVNLAMTGGEILTTGVSADIELSGQFQGYMTPPNGTTAELTISNVASVVMGNDAILDVNDRSSIVAGGGLYVLGDSNLQLDNSADLGSYEFTFGGPAEIEGILYLENRANLLVNGDFYAWDSPGGSSGGVIDVDDNATIYVTGDYNANLDADADFANNSELFVGGTMTQSSTAVFEVRNNADVEITDAVSNGVGTAIRVYSSGVFDAGDTTNAGVFLYDSNSNSTLGSLTNSGDFDKNRNSSLTATDGFTNTGGTGDISDGRLVLPSGPFLVSGGTVNIPARLDADDATMSQITGGVVNFNGTWNNAGHININGGRLVMTAGTLTQSSGHDIMVRGNDAFDWSGGHVDGGGLLIYTGAQIFDGTSTGDFARPLFVEDDASLTLASSGGGPEFEFNGGGTVEGNVTQTGNCRVDMASLIINVGTQVADGQWRQRNTTDFNIAVNATFNGGDFIGEATTTTDIGGDVTTNAGGDGPDILCQGDMTVAGVMDQNAGTLLVDASPGGATGRLRIQGSGTPSHDVANSDVAFQMGATYENSTSYNHVNGSFTLGGSSARLSNGAGNDATFINVNGTIQYGDVEVADDLQIRDGSTFIVQDTTGVATDVDVGDTLEVSSTTGVRSTLDVRLYTVSDWDVGGGLWGGGAADAVFDVTQGTMTYSFDTADISTGGHHCNGTIDCSVVVDDQSGGAVATLLIKDAVIFDLDEAIYASSGAVDIDETAVVNVAGTSGDDIAFFDDLYGPPSLNVDGELHVQHLTSEGTFTVADGANPALVDIPGISTFGDPLLPNGTSTGHIDTGGVLNTDTMYVEPGVSTFDTSGDIAVVNNLEIDGAVFSQNAGNVNVGDLLRISGVVAPSDPGLYNANAADSLTFNRFRVADRGYWTIEAGVTAATINALEPINGRTDGLVDGGGELFVNGELDLVTGAVDATGVSPAGCNLYMQGLLDNTGTIWVHKELRVDGGGQLDNDGTINVSRDATEEAYSATGCRGGDSNSCGGAQAAGSIITNGGTINLGYDFHVYGSGYQSQGTLNLGCRSFSPCIPGDVAGTDLGAIWVTTGANFETGTGASVYTATGSVTHDNCDASSAVIVSGAMTLGETTWAEVNGDFCVSGTGTTSVDGTLDVSSLLVNGVAGGVDDGDIVVANGGLFQLVADGGAVANDFIGGTGAVLQLTGNGGDVPVDFVGDGEGLIVVPLPLLRLDRDKGGNTVNSLTVGQLSQADGTVWTDWTVTLNGPGLDSMVGADGRLYGTNLVLDAAMGTLAVSGSAQVLMEKAAFGFGDNDFASDVGFTGTSQFVTNQNVTIGTGATFGFGGSTMTVDDAAGMPIVSVAQNATFATATGAVATVDGYLHLSEGAAGATAPGQLVVTDSTLSVSANEDSRYYLGGQVGVGQDGTLNLPSFVLKSDTVDQASITLAGNAVFNVDTGGGGTIPAGWRCTDPAFGASGVGPEFGTPPGPVRPQWCSRLHGNASIEMQGTSQLITDNRIIVNSDDGIDDDGDGDKDRVDPDPNNRLGIHIRDNAVLTQTRPSDGNIEHGLGIREDAVVTVSGSATLDATLVHTYAIGDNSGWAGTLVLAENATLNTDYLNLDAESRMFWYGDSATATIRYNAAIDAVVPYELDLPGNSWVIAPHDGLYGTAVAGPGTPLAACGGGGGGGPAAGGGGADEGTPSGAGGVCLTCFVLDDHASGNTEFVSITAGSRGAHGTGGAGSLGGNGAGRIYIAGEDGTTLHAYGNMIATGQDAPDFNNCPGGGGAGGAISLWADSLDIGPSLTVNVDGGAGGESTGVGENDTGGGGAGGMVQFAYRSGTVDSDDFRRVYARGGDGFEPGHHGVAALFKWNDILDRTEDVASTFMVFRSPLTVNTYSFYGDWNQLDPIDEVDPVVEVDGLVTDTADMTLVVDGDITFARSDWLQYSDDVRITMLSGGGIDMFYSNFVDQTAATTTTVRFTSSGTNTLHDQSSIQVDNIDVVGASGTWIINGGGAGTKSGMIGETIDITNVDNLTVGPYAYLTGNIDAETNATGSITIDRAGDANATELNADGMVCSGGTAGVSAGGGYGGDGGDGIGFGGAYYGVAISPSDVGSPGGDGPGGPGTDTGGCGGGSIRLSAPTCAIDSLISSNGLAGTGDGGGGSGGSILVDCPTLSFPKLAPTDADTILEATGGSDGAGGTGGGGGGGNVSVISDSELPLGDLLECNVGPGLGDLADGEVGNCSHRVGAAAPYDLIAYQGFRMQEDDRGQLGAAAAPAVVTLQSFRTVGATELTSNFSEVTGGLGYIAVNTDFELTTNSSWQPWDATDLSVTGTLTWDEGSSVGGAADPTDMNINLGVAGRFRSDADLGVVTIRAIPGLAPRVELGQSGSVITPHFAADDFDLHLANGGNLAGEIHHYRFYTVNGVGRGGAGGVFGSLDGAVAGPAGSGGEGRNNAAGAGGGSGGMGADGQPGAGIATLGGAYASTTRAPATVGGGGGAGWISGIVEPPQYYVGAGGNGGGRARLAASILEIRGTINVDGADGVVSASGEVGGGGGAGGQIMLEADAFAYDANMRLFARGGDGADAANLDGGGGAGGRVAVVLHGGAAAAAETLAEGLHDPDAAFPEASVAAGDTWDPASLPENGTMGVVWDQADAVAANDQVFAVTGWRHDDTQAVQIDIFDASRDVVLNDVDLAVTINANKIELGDASWYKNDDLTLVTTTVGFLDTIVNLASGTLSLDIANAVTVDDSDLMATDVNIDGNASGWTFNNGSTLVATDMIQISDVSSLAILNTNVTGNIVASVNGNINVSGSSILDSTGLGSGAGIGPGVGANGTAATFSGGGGGNGGVGGQGTPGDTQGALGGRPVGSSLQPTLSYGSNGGNGFDPGATGGRGGGVQNWNATGTFTLDGIMRANGGDSTAAGTTSGGGGAGGNIGIVAGIVEVTGQIEARGGDAAFAANLGGGGSGGRIFVAASGFQPRPEKIDVRSGVGNVGALAIPPQPGTAGMVNLTDSSLTVVGGWRFEPTDLAQYANYLSMTAIPSTMVGIGSGTILQADQDITVTISGPYTIEADMMQDTGGNNFVLTATAVTLNDDLDPTVDPASISTGGGNLIIAGTTAVTLNGSTNINLVEGVNVSAGTASIIGSGDLFLNSSSEISGNLVFRGEDFVSAPGSYITASTFGEAEATGAGAPVPQVTSGGSGGGYGGAGGAGTPFGAGGGTYGDPNAPTDLGSGGGSAHNGSEYVGGTGGTGGGAVRVIATSSADVQGAIEVNGRDGIVESSGAYAGGGGAGGSIFVSSGGALNVPGTFMRAFGGLGPNGNQGDGGGGGGGLIALCAVGGAIDASNALATGGGKIGDGSAGIDGQVTTNCAPITPTTAVLVATNDVHMGDIDVPLAISDFPIVAFSITELTGNDGAVMDSIAFQGAGTIDESVHISDMTLVIDSNYNGIRDGGDVIVEAGQTFSGNDGTVSFDLTSLATIPVDGNVDLLLTGDLNALSGDTVEVVFASNNDAALTGEASGSPGLVTGAPMYSGVKTVSLTPEPAVASFDPIEGPNDAVIAITIYGINFTGATVAQFDAIPPHTFSNLVVVNDSVITADISVPDPVVQPGYYNVQVTHPTNGTNATSSMLFRLYEPCFVPGEVGLCELGQQVGQLCEQVTFPGEVEEICDDGIDQDCDGADLACNDEDNDDDGYSPNEGDCDDFDADNTPDHGAGTPLAGLVCIITDEHIPTNALAGTPGDLGTYVMAFDTATPTWRNDPNNDWAATARDSLLGSGMVLEGGDEHLVVNYSPLLYPGPKMTISGWIRFDAVPTQAVIAAAGNLSPFQPVMALYYDGGEFRFGLGTSDGTYHLQAVPAAIVTDHWYQLAGTYDVDTLTMRFYLDGVMVLEDVLTVPVGTQVLTSSFVDLHIGSHPDFAPMSVYGAIDEVRIFGDEISNLDFDYDALRTHQPSVLSTTFERLHLNMNAGFGDVSGNQLDATPQATERISGRSHESDFPSVAYTVSTDAGVDVYYPVTQGTHELFMRLPLSVNPGQGAIQGGNIIAAEMMNGVLAVADEGVGLVVFDFAADSIYRISTAGTETYSGGFTDLVSGTYTIDPTDTRTLASDNITSLAIGADGTDVQVALGHSGFITAVEITATNPASGSLVLNPGEIGQGLTFGQPGDPVLYYGVGGVVPAAYAVISDLTTWIGDAGRARGPQAIVIPNATSTINDADFAQAASTGEWRLTVASDQGLTYGIPSGDDSVPGGNEVHHIDGTLLCPTNDVISTHFDFDSRYSACAGAGGGVTSWDDGAAAGAGLVAEYIDDTILTNDMGQLESLDIRGVGGYTEICVVTDLGLDCFFRPLSQGLCNTGLAGVCGANGGTQYPLSGPPITDNVCVQEVFPEHEDCGGDDLDCDGFVDPNAPGIAMCGGSPCVCVNGIPWVDVGPDVDIDILDCTPQVIPLQDPVVVDDTDPNPEITQWTSTTVSPVAIDGNYGEWDVGNQIGTAAGTTYHFESGFEQLSFAALGPDLTGSDGLRIAIGLRAGGDGCTTIPNSGVEILNPTVKANFVIEMNAATYGIRKCTDPLTDTFGPLDPVPLTRSMTAGGIEFSIDTTHAMFTGSDLQVGNDTDYVAFWVYDSVGTTVDRTYPVNPEFVTTPPNMAFQYFHELDRTVPANNLFPVGAHVYRASATDFDGNVGYDLANFTVNKTTDPFIAPLSDISVAGTMPMQFVEWRCQGGDARLPDCGDGGASYMDDDDVAPPGHSQNCMGGLTVQAFIRDTMVPVTPAQTYMVGTTTTILIRVTDALSTTETEFDIEVTDGIPPVVTWHVPPVVQLAATNFYYIGAADAPFTDADLDTLYDVTDNADPPPPASTVVVCSSDIPGPGLDPLPGDSAVATLTCIDLAGNPVVEQLTVVRMLPSPITIDFVITDVTGGGEVVVDGVDPDDDPDNWFAMQPTLRVTVLENTGPGEECLVGDPIFGMAGNDNAYVVAGTDQYDWLQTTEGLSQVDVSGQSMCDPATLTSTTFDIAIDTLDPVIDLGFNRPFGAPRQISDTDDLSMYDGWFAIEDDPDFEFAGQISDAGCGLVSLNIDVYKVAVDGGDEFLRDNASPDTFVTRVIDETFSLMNPPLGPPIGDNVVTGPPDLPTTGPWGDGVSGVSFPVDADAGAYELILTATDCAGHTLEQTYHAYNLTLELAIGRLVRMTERFQVTLQGMGNYAAVEPSLIISEEAYNHAGAAIRQTDETFADPPGLHPLFSTSLRGISVGLDELSIVLALVEADLGVDEPHGLEIRRKAHEIALGARLWNDLWYDHLDTNTLFVEEDARIDADTNLVLAAGFHDPNAADNGPATLAAAATRWAAYFTDLSQNETWSSVLDNIVANPVNPSFLSATSLLSDLRERVDEYINAVDADDLAEGSQYLLGRAEMVAIQADLDHIDLVFRCEGAHQAGGSIPGDCAGFDGSNPRRPSSRNLAENIVDILLLQQKYYEIALDAYVDTDNLAFLSGVMGSVAFANGITNAGLNVCGGPAHPAIANAVAERSDVEILRDDIGPGDTSIEAYSTAMSAEDPLCAAVYAYNAAYVLDTAWYRINIENEELEAFDRNSYGGLLAFCFPDDPAHDCEQPVPINCSLPPVRRTLFLSQDLYDDVTCRCSGDYWYISGNQLWCIGQGVSEPLPPL